MQGPRPNALVTICGGYGEAEAALRLLQAHHFGLNNVSLVGRGLSSGGEMVGWYEVGEGCKYWGPLGAFWEGLWELLDGCGVFWLSNCGWVLFAGPFIKTFIVSLRSSSVFSGLTPIGSALYSLGIPLRDVVRYEASLTGSQLLLIVQGAASVVENGRQLLEGKIKESL